MDSSRHTVSIPDKLTHERKTQRTPTKIDNGVLARPQLHFSLLVVSKAGHRPPFPLPMRGNYAS